MRLIDADELKEAIEQGEGFSWNSHGKDDLCVRKKYIDNAPTIEPHEDLISANDFKKRLNNMEYVYLQACYSDLIDAIDCEVTYFKEKINHGKK